MKLCHWRERLNIPYSNFSVSSSPIILCVTDIGLSRANRSTPSESNAIFFMMYCPTKVGTNGCDQVISGRIHSGITVVKRWKSKIAKVNRSSLGIRIRKPISTSNTPNARWKVSGSINFKNVESSKSTTNGPAGERRKTFKIPKQKKMRKSCS